MKKAEEYLEEAFKNNLTSPIYEIKDSKTVILKLIKQAQLDAVDEFITRLVEDDKAAEYFTQDDDPDYLEVMYYSAAIYDLHKQLRKEIE